MSGRGEAAEPFRVGVVGVGVIGQNHARILSDMRGVRLVGVVDPLREQRGIVERAAGVPGFASVEELIAEGIDAAVVAVPTIRHHEVGMRLIEAGAHLLVEKPIASTVEEAKELIEGARRRGLALAVGHVERFNPAIWALKQAVGSERVISLAVTRVGPFPPRVNDVGIVIDLGVHDIDLVRWITESEIVDHQVLLSHTRGGHEDIAFLQFRTQSGALAHINTNWLTPFKERRINVSTLTRFITCDLLLRTVVEFSNYREDGSFTSRSLSVGHHEPLRAELAAFVAAAKGEAPAAVSGEDGLKSLEIALTCLRGAGRR